MAAVSDQVARKTLDIIVKAAQVTPEVLKDILREFMKSGGTKQCIRTTIAKLAEQSGRKLESIEVNASNIKDFEQVAQKHKVQYALRREAGSDPPVYHVIFQASRLQDMQKAFAEYAGIMQEKIAEKTIPKERRQEIAAAARLAEKPRSQNKTVEKQLSHGEVSL